MALLPEARGLGLGTRLIEAALAKAARNGVDLGGRPLAGPSRCLWWGHRSDCSTTRVAPCHRARMRGFLVLVALPLWVTLGCGSCGGAQRPSNQSDCPEGMVFVPGGTFSMGDASPDALPYQRAHPQTVGPYCIDRTEVTVAAFDACDSVGCGNPVGPPWGQCTRPGMDDSHPRNCVTWYQAIAYCTWRDARLPTSAEWEFAARGTDGRLYPWGNTPAGEDSARWNVQGYARVHTAPVGSHAQDTSPFGVLDLAGNVSEWTNGEGEGVVRGGAWGVTRASRLGTFHQVALPGESRDSSCGFRCAF